MLLNDLTEHDTAVIIVFFAELFEVERDPGIGVHGIKFLRCLGEDRL